MAFASRHENRVVAHPDDPAIFAPQAILRLKTLGSHAVLFRRLDEREVFFSNKSSPIFGACQPFFLCVTKNGFHLRAHVMPFAVQANFRDIAHGRHLLDEQLVLGFGLRVRPLDTQAFADVPGYADDAPLRHRGDGHFHRNPRAVSAAQGDLFRPFARPLQRVTNMIFKQRDVSLIVNFAPAFPEYCGGSLKSHHFGESGIRVQVAAAIAQDRYSVRCGIHRQRMRHHLICAMGLTVLADPQPRGVTNDGNS